MGEIMSFPETVEEFMAQYKMVDTKEIYSNGTEYVPIFRMRQWFEHISAQPKTGEWVDDNGRPYKGKPTNSCWCSECGEWLVASDEYSVSTNFCPNCGAKMLNGGEG